MLPATEYAVNIGTNCHWKFLEHILFNFKIVFRHFRQLSSNRAHQNFLHIWYPLQSWKFKRTFWSPVLRLLVCSCVCKLFSFSSFLELFCLFQSNFERCSPGSKKGPSSFSRRDNNWSSKIHWRFFFRSSSTEALGYFQPNLKQSLG